MPAVMTVISSDMIVDYVNGRLDPQDADEVRELIVSDGRAKHLADAARHQRERVAERLKTPNNNE